MTKKELLKKLIAHYKKVIKLTEGKTNRDIKKIAKGQHVYYGICHASTKLFKKHIFDAKWLQSHYKYGIVWWFQPVCECRSKEQSIKALQNRVDKMKEILKTCK